MQWLVSVGATVWMPVFAAPDYDLIADFGEKRGPRSSEDIDVPASESLRRGAVHARW